jgi:hypothetical protein
MSRPTNLNAGCADVVVLDAIQCSDLRAFLRKVFGTVCPGCAFLPSWHLDAMCYELAKILTGEIRRLIISIPPAT